VISVLLSTITQKKEGGGGGGGEEYNVYNVDWEMYFDIT